MSECVVRMEMPKENCLMCDLRYECNAFYAPGKHKPFMKGCRIVCSLPEGHGRLVDAEAYSAEMKDRQEAAWKWRNEAISEEDELKLARAEGSFTAFVEAKLTWDKQVTIVPADTAERSET